MTEENWNGNERRKSPEFCQAHIPMTNSIARIETSIINIEKIITQSTTFKTAMAGSIVLIVLALIGQGVLYGRLLEKVDITAGTLTVNQTEIKELNLKLAKLDNQVEVNTLRWNKVLK